MGIVSKKFPNILFPAYSLGKKKKGEMKRVSPCMFQISTSHASLHVHARASSALSSSSSSFLFFVTQKSFCHLPNYQNLFIISLFITMPTPTKEMVVYDSSERNQNKNIKVKIPSYIF